MALRSSPLILEHVPTGVDDLDAVADRIEYPLNRAQRGRRVSRIDEFERADAGIGHYAGDAEPVADDRANGPREHRAVLGVVGEIGAGRGDVPHAGNSRRVEILVIALDARIDDRHRDLMPPGFGDPLPGRLGLDRLQCPLLRVERIVDRLQRGQPDIALEDDVRKMRLRRGDGLADAQSRIAQVPHMHLEIAHVEVRYRLGLEFL